MNEDFLAKKLNEREKANSLRTLVIREDKIDFCSNDYLGIAKNNLLYNAENNMLAHGSTGSRLLSGNYELVENTEKVIAGFHDANAALIFNSGYDANVGLLASVPQKGDVIIYDKLSHASIRDGIRLSFADSFSFIHNDITDLEKKMVTASHTAESVFVVTESVFSMDGDMAPLVEISALCEKYNAGLIVDEAHATGVIGARGEGVVQQLNLQRKCFARIHTFGKACGCHGAVILGSDSLKKYLTNFARPFIYSTALPPSAVKAIATSYEIFPAMNEQRMHLHKLVNFFKETALKYEVVKSSTPIQVVIIPGNDEVRKVAGILQNYNYDVRAILHPTVPKGRERIRIVLHSYNSMEEVEQLLKLLNQ